MAQRTCDMPDCERKHLARGLCSSHYGTWHRKVNGRKRNADYFPIVCVACGADHLAARRESKYCSELCRDYTRWGARTCAWPRPTRRVAKPKPEPFAEHRECDWCGEGFVARVRSQRFCSSDHKVKAKRHRRRGQQYGSTSHFTWAEFMHLFVNLDRQCAYCEDLIDGQPDPDHVVPLSRGGSNSITNILPACRLCNSDKRDLLLSEWVVDRERRGLPLRVTDVTNPRWGHLTDALLAA